MMKRIIIISLLMLAASGAGAQVYVATDKSCYVAGETVWCSVFCADGPSVAYLELASADGPAARARIDVRGGRGGGSLAIPVATPTGNYRLFAYTSAEDMDQSGPVISVFNTFSTDRVRDGVEIVDATAYPGSAAVQTGYGFSAQTAGSIVLENTSGKRVSCCISLTRSDSVADPGFRSIASFDQGEPSAASFGETLKGVLAGRDASSLVADAERDSMVVFPLIAIPGTRTDCYAGRYAGNGEYLFDTENIFGGGDLVCMVEGLGEGQDCHLELVSPFLSPRAADLPKLKLCRKMEADLLRRSAAMADERAADSVAVTLPMRRDHFFLTHECVSYILDDYRRFPTMEEVFVEITPNVKLRRRGGIPRVYVLMRTSVSDATPRWGDAMMMIDGVPIPDHKLIETYDPAIVKVLEVYPYRYNFGGVLFDGVVNLVTYKGNMPGVLLDDNVRIYDFPGCSWPMVHSGSETPYWHPLVTMEPGERLMLPDVGLEADVVYTLSVEGLTSDTRPVYLRKSFVR